MANQLTHIAKAQNAAEELERTIKSFHGATFLISLGLEENEIDERVFYLLDGIGTNLQLQFTELNRALKALV